MRLFVEVHPVERRDSDDDRHHAQSAQGDVTSAPGRGLSRSPGHDGQGEHGGDSELAEALVDVLGIGEAGGLLQVVVAAEQGGRLRNEEGEEDGIHDQNRGEPLELVPAGSQRQPQPVEAGGARATKAAASVPAAMKVARTARAGRSFQVMSGVRASTHEANNASAEANRAPKTTSRTAETTAVRAAGSHACTLLDGFNVRRSQGSPRTAASGTAAAVPSRARTEVALVEFTAANASAASRHSTVIHSASRTNSVASSSATRPASSVSRRVQRRPARVVPAAKTVPTTAAKTRRSQAEVAVGEDGGREHAGRSSRGDDARTAAGRVGPVGRQAAVGRGNRGLGNRSGRGEGAHDRFLPGGRAVGVAGEVTSMRQPRSPSATAMVPPCGWATQQEIASPRPVPLL